MIKTKNIYIVCCEGASEVNIFGFLKKKYANQSLAFKVHDLKGFNDHKNFLRAYNSVIKKWSLKPKQNSKNTNVHFIFFIDNDLEESEMIKNTIIKGGHMLQFSEPNIEGLLLSIVGDKQGQNFRNEDFRQKCKDSFLYKFEISAAKIKDAILDSIFTELIFSKNLTTLAKLFKKQN